MIADEYLLTLLRQGEKLTAVKAYREEKGCSLREAKDYIDALEQGMRSTILRKVPDTKPDEKVLRLIRQGEKLMAVKVYKEQTGCDLIVAKNLIDELYEQIGPKPQPRKTSSFKDWSASLKDCTPKTPFTSPQRPIPQATRQSNTPVTSTSYDDIGGHYDKGERQGCLGALLLLPVVTLLSFLFRA